MEQRLNELKRMLTEEEKSSERSQLYIDDLTLTIAHLEKELKAKTKKGYELVK